MPAGEKIRTAYLEAAKTIHPDIEYGKTIRALER
jgi:DnaJ-class molecular chaperone